MVKVKNNDSYGIDRLESKNAKNAIHQKLAQDFNLTPIIAEAFINKFLYTFMSILTFLFQAEKYLTKLSPLMSQPGNISD